MECYEVPNTCMSDMPIDEQIRLGFNDWLCEGPAGHAYGHTEHDARDLYRRMAEGEDLGNPHI